MEGFVYKDKERDELLDYLMFAYNHIPVGLLLVNREHIIVSANQQVVDGFGYFWPEDLVGNEIHMLVEESFKERHKKIISSWFDNPPKMGFHNKDLKGVKEDGSRIIVTVSLTPYYKKIALSMNGGERGKENHFAIASIVWLES